MSVQITSKQKYQLLKLGLPSDYLWVIEQASEAGYCVEGMKFDEVFDIVTKARSQVLKKRLKRSLSDVRYETYLTKLVKEYDEK